MKSVLCLPEHNTAGEPHATAYIRILRPLGHRSLSGRFNLVVCTRASREIGECDIAILERFWHPDVTLAEARGLVDRIRSRCRYFIYTLDDNILDLGLDAPWRSPIREQHRSAVRLFAREADGLIVSTRRLLQRFSRLASTVELVENALDESLFQNRSPSAEQTRDHVRAVYMGTGTHQEDLLMILEPLRRVLVRHKGRFRLDLLGVVPNQGVLKLFEGLPVQPVPGLGWLEYPSFASWWSANARWDFGIAPLRDTAFNQYKSDIKFLDYGIVGIPGIFSQGAAYSGTVKHHETGLLCGPDPGEWEESLETLIESREMRRNLSANVRKYVDDCRVLKLRARDWAAAIERICGIAEKRH